MTGEEQRQLVTFEARLRHLMHVHDELKKKNQSLMDALKEKEQALQQLRHDYDQLESCYTNLKQARIISIHDSDVDDTRKRISKLVREVDKCLALLNG